MDNQQLSDVIIIGAGPVGLFAVFQCGMMNLTAQVVDILPEIGGQCTALYPEKPIYDIPGYPHILAGTLIEQLYEQIKSFHPTFHLNQKVTGLTENQGIWQVALASGKILHAKAVILASGNGLFEPNRPPLPQLDIFENKSVLYSVRDMKTLQGKSVVIAGGGDSAIDWALALRDTASRIIFVHRRWQFRASPQNEGRLKEAANSGAIEMMIPYHLSHLEGTADGHLQKVWVKTLEDEKCALDADYLLCFFGLTTQLGPLATLGLTMEKTRIVVDPTTSATSQPGIYGIGDCVTYSNKQKLILTGFSEAAQAAAAIRRQLFPDQLFHFAYSTTTGVPGFKK